MEFYKFKLLKIELWVISLLQLGIRKLFNIDADLTGISSTDKDLLVRDVVQKTFINVTETGTEAAAATAGKWTPFLLVTQ